MSQSTDNLESAASGAPISSAPGISAPSREAALKLWPCIHADALAHVPPENRGALRGGPVWLVTRVLLVSSGMRCALLYRLAHTARYRIPAVGAILSKLLFWVGRHWYGCSIASAARIGGGLILPHPVGIVIGGDARIGARAWIFQNATIGGAPNKKGMPIIGDDARIYAGAVIVGPIKLGDDVVVGANAVVHRDVPSRSSVRAANVEVRGHSASMPGQGQSNWP